VYGREDNGAPLRREGETPCGRHGRPVVRSYLYVCVSCPRLRFGLLVNSTTYKQRLRGLEQLDSRSIKFTFAHDGCLLHAATAYAVHVNQRVLRQRSFSQSFSLRLPEADVTSNSVVHVLLIKGGASPDQLHGSICSLCILLQECILHHYISPHATRETVSPTLRSTAMTSTCRIPL
jgi:hypothetical protein